MSDLSSFELAFLSGCNSVVAGISIIALLIFYCSVFLFSREKLTFSLKLICHLFFADLLYAIANIISNFSGHIPGLCQFEGFLRTYALWSTILWAYIIGLVVYNTTVTNFHNIHERYWQFVLLACIFPIIVAVLPLFGNLPFSYDVLTTYCWIISDNQVLALWLFFFLWAWILVIMTTILYIRLYFYLRRLNINTQVVEYRGVLIYPIILYVSLIPATLHDSRVFTSNQFPIAVVHIALLHSLGFSNCLVYGYQRIMAIGRRRGSSVVVHQQQEALLSNEIHNKANALDNSW